VAIPDPPAPFPAIEVPEFELHEIAPLWSNLPDPVNADQPRNMESFGQSYGYILYRTKLKSAASGELVLPALRSYARVYVNSELVGVADRRMKQDRIKVEAKAGDILDILVEGTGRINFSRELLSERQGINGPVTLAGRELTRWQLFPLPMVDLSHLQFVLAERGATGPAFYQGHFELQATGDTFLDLRGWGKGAVWINGHALGRFWNVGPQQTLYAPAPFLQQGDNQVVIFTLGTHRSRLSGLHEPVLDEMGSE
jgi:beta-galactosidase